MHKTRHISYHEELLQLLQEPEEALAYLNTALKDKDQRVFLLALKDVLKAYGGTITTLSHEAHLDRKNLLRILSKKGNPKLTTLRSLLHALGLELAIQPLKTQ